MRASGPPASLRGQLHGETHCGNKKTERRAPRNHPGSMNGTRPNANVGDDAHIVPPTPR